MIEKKKLNSELQRVRASKAEMDYQRELKLEEVKRLEAAMIIQDEAEKTINEKLKLLGG